MPLEIEYREELNAVGRPHSAHGGPVTRACPGGGHSKLCLGHEGYALGEWFRDHGIAAFVLKYRLAREKGSTYTIQDHAMADARRANGIVLVATVVLVVITWIAALAR